MIMLHYDCLAHPRKIYKIRQTAAENNTDIIKRDLQKSAKRHTGGAASRTSKIKYK